MKSEFEKARDEYISEQDFPTPVEMCLHAEKPVIICHNEALCQQGADWAFEWSQERTLRYDRIVKDLEAKLAKAVEGLKDIEGNQESEWCFWKAQQCLKEIQGEHNEIKGDSE